MGNVNTVAVSGNLTRDPDLRATLSGTSVLGFCVAVNDRRRSRDTGQWEDYTNYFDCTVLGNSADALGRILRKGMLVTVCGKLRYSSWEKDGQKRSKVDILAGEVQLPRREAGEGGSARPRDAYDIYDEEIPF